jgi:hypothetical protein
VADTQEGQENQQRKYHTDEGNEIGVNAGKIAFDQSEGESPNNGDKN